MTFEKLFVLRRFAAKDMYECISVHHHVKTCSIACLIQCF
uniref:Uncharacterized protein n=1 Tax=Anguilla anguilla TaxID=7936 RepID=A0A0E9XWF6_ANGAN